MFLALGNGQVFLEKDPRDLRRKAQHYSLPNVKCLCKEILGCHKKTYKKSGTICPVKSGPEMVCALSTFISAHATH